MYNLYSCNRKKKGTRIDKNGEEITKLQKIYLTFYNFLIAQIYGKLIIKSCQ